MSRARREDQDAELQRVLDDLEAEHGGAPHAHMLARRHTCSDETALRDARDRAEVAHAEAAHRDRLGASRAPKMSKRALEPAAADMPDGYAHDHATGFLFCAATGWYLERTPTRELHCHQSVGVWCYWDMRANEWRPFPADLLTPSEQALARVVSAASSASAGAVPTPLPLAAVPMTAAEAAAAAAAAAAAMAAKEEAAAAAAAAAAAEAEAEAEAAGAAAEAACAPHRAAPPLRLPDLSRRTVVRFLTTAALHAAPPRKPKRRQLAAAAPRAADGGEGVEEADAPRNTGEPPSAPSLSTGPAAAAVPAAVSVPPPPGPAEVHAAAAGAAVVDMSRLVCLLCQRQFKSAEMLQRHVAFSRLHADNLAQQPTLPQQQPG